MLSIVLFLELALFCMASAAMLPVVMKYWRSLNQNTRILGIAWSAMIVGQHQIFAHEGYVEGLASINVAASYQLIWMLIAGLVSLPIILSTKISPKVWALPVSAFIAYIFFAFGSVVFSAAPSMTIYRAMQLAVIAALLVMAYSILRRAGKPDFLVHIGMFWLVILLFSVIVGALLLPERAFVENRGALGMGLRGVIPSIHQNELGLMAAIGFVVGIVRGLGGASKGWYRVFWFSVALIAGTILFLAQARTSLASSLIALFAVGFMVRRLRWLAYLILGAGVIVGSYYILTGSKIGIEDQIETYARRGVSDEHMKNLSGRTGLWEVGWEMFKDSPVLGHGFQTGVRNKGIEYGLPFGTNMHSSHMQVLVDTGALGYIAWLVFVLGMSARVYKHYKYVDKSDDLARMFAVSNLLIVFVILFRSVLGHVLVSHQLNLVIFVSVYLHSVLSREAAATKRDTENESGGKIKDGINGNSRILSSRRRGAGD